ncbi:hypothetical protein Tco_1193744 [Tanacetum coccineum]
MPDALSRELYTGSVYMHSCKIGSEMGIDVADTLCFQLGGARHSMTWRLNLIQSFTRRGKAGTKQRVTATKPSGVPIIGNQLRRVGAANVLYLLHGSALQGVRRTHSTFQTPGTSITIGQEASQDNWS